MTDTRSPSQRHQIMSAVKQKNTGPELTLRRALHNLGYRYRLHRADLPGTPDIVFPRRRCVIFVHGCFWHGHKCTKGQLPKSRLEYWAPKVESNAARDARHRSQLEVAGWKVMEVWQCELRDLPQLLPRIQKFLG